MKFAILFVMLKNDLHSFQYNYQNKILTKVYKNLIHFLFIFLLQLLNFASDFMEWWITKGLGKIMAEESLCKYTIFHFLFWHSTPLFLNQQSNNINYIFCTLYYQITQLTFSLLALRLCKNPLFLYTYSGCPLIC